MTTEIEKDAARALRKAANVLRAVERYLTAYNESMAALHMSEKVMQSPLTSAVSAAVWDATEAANRLDPEEIE